MFTTIVEVLAKRKSLKAHASSSALIDNEIGLSSEGMVTILVPVTFGLV